MRILCIGDIVGSIGVAAFGKKMPELRQKYSPDIIIVNGENAGDGCSITAPNCGALFMFGADVITGGNHSLYSRDMTEIYEREDGALRPANLHPNAPGSGIFVYERGKYRCAVVSLIGDVFLDLAFESPFLAADKILKKLDCKTVVFDIHAAPSCSARTPMFPPQMRRFCPAERRISPTLACAVPLIPFWA